jgi:hypothetical protein
MCKRKPRVDQTKLTTAAEMLAHTFVGNYHADHKTTAQIDAFAANPAHPVAERAAVLRHLYHAALGLEGFAAGDNETDEELVASHIVDWETSK